MKYIRSHKKNTEKDNSGTTENQSQKMKTTNSLSIT